MASFYPDQITSEDFQIVDELAFSPCGRMWGECDCEPEIDSESFVATETFDWFCDPQRVISKGLSG